VRLPNAAEGLVEALEQWREVRRAQTGKT